MQQSRVRQAVGVVKSYLNSEVAPIAVGMLQELEDLSLIDMSAEPAPIEPITGENAAPAPREPTTGETPAATDPSAALPSDQGVQGADPVAALFVRQSEPSYLN